MNWWLRASKYLIAMLVLLFFATPIVSAQDSGTASQFETSLETTYDVQDSGTTSVTHNFSVRNLQPTIYLKEYSLNTSFPNLQNISAKSGQQELEPNVSTNGNKTQIQIAFPDEVVGQNKIRQFSVSYDIPKMAVIAGQVLEVQIPPLVSADPYKQHTIILKTPLRFGRAIRMSPAASAVILENNQIITTINQTEPQPISAYFGDRQVYQMTLRYNLENNSSSQSIAQVALPPDTSFQKVQYVSLDPYPREFKRDVDGNWIGTYDLAPNSANTVYLTALVLVTLDPQSSFPIIQPQSFHTKEAKYWETNNPNIKKILEGKSSVEELYTYVVETLSYSHDIVNQDAINRRLGAVEALNKPTDAVCQEFTDTFIALARASGTPARRLTGFAYTQNPDLRPVSLETDVLHAWPEYYNSEANLWQPVDPTWQSTTGGVDYFTKFDLSHVVFAINGESSTTPYPAGSYKGSDLTTKDVEVSFTQTFPVVNPDLKIEVYPEQLFTTAIPGKHHLVVVNNTGQAWYDVNVTLQTDAAGVEIVPTNILVPALLPYQRYDVPLSLYSTENNWNTTATVNYSYVIKDQTINENNQGSFELSIAPNWFKYLTEQNLLIALGGLCAILILGTGGILVFRRARKRFIRR